VLLLLPLLLLHIAAPKRYLHMHALCRLVMLLLLLLLLL
jgi:hypothetical protein